MIGQPVTPSRSTGRSMYPAPRPAPMRWAEGMKPVDSPARHSIKSPGFQVPTQPVQSHRGDPEVHR